jgi:predicted deacylase
VECGSAQEQAVKNNQSIPPLKVKDYSQLLQCVALVLKSAEEVSIVLQEVSSGSQSYPLLKVVLGVGNPRKALITAGIHGDELVGVEAVCAFFERRLYRPWGHRWELTVLPCVNPWGYEYNRRTNHDGRDLNREFKSSHPPSEVLFVQSLDLGRYELSLDLHDDADSSGYYLYQTVDSDEEAKASDCILRRVNHVVPINRDSEIEGRPVRHGVIRRPCAPSDMEWWPLAVYALQHGVKHNFTLEAGTASSTQVRINAHLAAIDAALEYFSAIHRDSSGAQ